MEKATGIRPVYRRMRGKSHFSAAYFFPPACAPVHPDKKKAKFAQGIIRILR